MVMVTLVVFVGVLTAVLFVLAWRRCTREPQSISSFALIVVALLWVLWNFVNTFLFWFLPASEHGGVIVSSFLSMVAGLVLRWMVPAAKTDAPPGLVNAGTVPPPPLGSTTR